MTLELAGFLFLVGINMGGLAFFYGKVVGRVDQLQEDMREVKKNNQEHIKWAQVQVNSYGARAEEIEALHREPSRHWQSNLK